MSKEFDDKMQEHTDAMNAGRMMELELLRKEIQYEDYDTVDQVKGAISNRIEVLNNSEGDSDE